MAQIEIPSEAQLQSSFDIARFLLRYMSTTRPGGVTITQAAWFIDPVAGNDLASGATSGSALKTFARLKFLWGTFPLIDQVTTLTMLGDLADTDPMDIAGICPVFGKNGRLKVVASAKTAPYSGTITTLTSNIARASNTRAVIIDTAVPTSWTAAGLVGQRLRFTGGTNPGAQCWVQKDNGAFTAQLSSQYIPDDGPAAGVMTLPRNFAGGDAYTVETLYSVAKMTCAYLSYDNAVVTGFGAFVVFENLRFTDASSTLQYQIGAPGTGCIQFIGCDMGALAPSAGIVLASGCKHAGPRIGGAPFTEMIFDAGYTVGRIDCSGFGYVQITGDTSSQGSTGLLRIRNGSFVRLGAGASFDSTGTGVVVETGSYLRAEQPFSAANGNSQLWGSGNTSETVRLQVGAKFDITTLANVTIAGGSDFTLGGNATGYAWDDANHVYSSTKFNYTWALLATAVASSGFGNRIVDPKTGCQIGLIS